MKRLFTPLLLLLALPVYAQQLNPGGGGGGISIGGPITIQSVNGGYLYADQFPGGAIDVKLSNAEAACPTTGCTIDASNLTGPQTWTPSPPGGPYTTVNLLKPTKLLLNGQISYTGAPMPNGLFHLVDTSGSGDDISCAHGMGINPVWPPMPNYPGGAITLNPPNLLQQWQCYILTNPTTPLASVNITSISIVSATTPPPSTPLAVVTATGPVPFTVGQGVRISGVTPDQFNTFAIVQNVSGNSFSFVANPTMSGTGSGGTAKAYMPVIDITYSTSNVNIHDVDFVANANTGSVIHESGGNRSGLGIVNNHYNHNQFINTDGIGGSGYAVEISSMGPHITSAFPPGAPPITVGGGLAENTNQKEVSYNNIAGLAGCFFIDQSNIVTANLVGNECNFWNNAPVVKLDCYQCVQTQNTDFRTNILYQGLGPADHPVVEIDSGYNINVENNDFELPNVLNLANVDYIGVFQAGMLHIHNNAFLSNAGVNAGRYSISAPNTAAASMIIENNHSSGGETDFFFDPPLTIPPASGGFQQFLYYLNNEDYGRFGPNTQIEPSVAQFTGSGSGVAYTTTSATFVPVDTSRMLDDFWMPGGYTAMIQASVDASNNTAGQAACIGLENAVTGQLLNQKVSTSQLGGEATVQYIIPGDSNHYQIELVFASCSGLGTTTVTNNSTPNRPVMTVQLVPGRGGTN